MATVNDIGKAMENGFNNGQSAKSGRLAFRKAEKKQARLRLAIFGPSGSGKTYTALRIATGMGGPIALVDTERSTSSKYADRFDFDTLDLDNKSIEEGYIPAIRTAEEGQYPVLIIDSLSHGWQELLEEVDTIARVKYRGNTWSAWSEGTPKQRRLVDAILSYPGHIIVTMRADTAWDQEKDERTGKVKPVKVGLKPQQGKGIEYEFDMLMELNTEHFGTITKDRTGKFQDKHMEKPGEEFGKALIGWLMQGREETTAERIQKAKSVLAARGHSDDAIRDFLAKRGATSNDAILAALTELWRNGEAAK